MLRLAEIDCVGEFDSQLAQVRDSHVDVATLVNGTLRLATIERRDLLERVLRDADLRKLVDRQFVDCVATHAVSVKRDFAKLQCVMSCVGDDAQQFLLSNATGTALVRVIAIELSHEPGLQLALLSETMRFISPGSASVRLLDCLELLAETDVLLCDFVFERLFPSSHAHLQWHGSASLNVFRQGLYHVARLRRSDLFERLMAAVPADDGGVANRALRVSAASNPAFLRQMLTHQSIRDAINLDRCLALSDAVVANQAESVAAILQVPQLKGAAILRALQLGFQAAGTPPVACIRLLVADPRIDPLSAEPLPFAVPVVKDLAALSSLRPELEEVLWGVVLTRVVFATWPLAALAIVPIYVMVDILDALPAAELVSARRKLHWITRLRGSVARIKETRPHA
jgi:hypothetical protein